MVGHNDSGASEKKSSKAVDDLQTFSAENMQNNMKIIYYRFVCILIGLIMLLFDSGLYS